MPESIPPTRPAFLKVTAYVTCERDRVLHLLLFRHPLAGIQLPAGSIEEGEAPYDAAVREVSEETGLRDMRDPASLATTTTELPPRFRITLRHEVPRLAPDPDATPSASPLSRGLTVELLELAANHAQVRADVLDYEQTPPTLVSRREGWVESASLGSLVVRHHVHLRHHGRGPTRWIQPADGHHFEPFWAPLIPRPAICPDQRDWMDLAYDPLIRRCQR